jgi:hypothetical protein
MSQFPYLRSACYTIAASFILFFLSACTILGAGGQAITPTPEPTSSIPDMQVVAPQACKVGEQNMIQVNEPQGDVIAWAPDANTVAYVASSHSSTWNVGDLNIIRAPLFSSAQQLATGVAGELTWSPDGQTIAYLGLRRSDNLYTIGLAYPDGRNSTDLFPTDAAKTDDYSSQKAILEWLDINRLRIMTSCGLDCMQKVDVDVQSGLSLPIGDPIQRAWGMWSPHTSQPTAIPTEVAGLPGQLNWSPDEKRIAYVDQIGNAWVINANSGNLYPLDIGQYGTATETDWSYDSQYLAIMVDQNLMIFSFNCP